MNYRRQSGYFQFGEHPSTEKVQSMANFMFEALLLINFCRRNLKFKNMTIKFYDFCITHL